jgi:hypothetical protein
MLQQIRNVGWPVPYGDTWPVSSVRPTPWVYVAPQQQNVVYSVLDKKLYFGVYYSSGKLIDTWV